MMHKNGSFIISLDYELAWGIIEKSYLKDYCKTNVRNVPIVVEKMLELFDKYQVNATFATVGFLMCKDKKELIKYTPDLKPSYTNKVLSPYSGFMESIEQDDPCFFYPSIIKRLKAKKNIEIASHTFCHYYCLEKGQKADEFEQDLVSANRIANDNGICLESIVFPRNNVNEDYLRVCYNQGIKCYRGNAKKFFGTPKNKYDRIKNRLCRLLDSYLPISAQSCYDYNQLKQTDGIPFNVPASRFFRPYNKKMALFEPLRILRIKNEIKYAAKTGKMYHLWWHPHNFGSDMTKNLEFLEKVLRCYSECNAKYGMQSYTMKDFINTLDN